MESGASSSPEFERLEATVRGRVQAVGFRVFVASRASALGLTGWVRNGSDGSVECIAEGRRVDLETLLAA
ncbi:MAG TPA: acylphosphatase, partial [Candidatus Limnocylindrales bacterium]